MMPVLTRDTEIAITTITSSTLATVRLECSSGVFPTLAVKVGLSTHSLIFSHAGRQSASWGIDHNFEIFRDSVPAIHYGSVCCAFT
jgi:hypothetical protein